MKSIHKWRQYRLYRRPIVGSTADHLMSAKLILTSGLPLLEQR